ncbi:sugar ABC transporter permease [uncultured Sphaerochaeta sp.]|uniref:carbohydrate ABC transporter permease n=1 Tax=uncultured Sphaerochaeta sp. TaxID=886478 RepID=UPI002A0A4E4D|nr:sugar ABC transporter permease [uncultured Sphaerochaeta sp.]
MRSSAKQVQSNRVINRNRKTAFFFLLPNFLGFAIFTLVPVVWAIGLSFTKWDGSSAPIFVGLRNYIHLFQYSSFTIAFWNTVVYTIGTVPLIILFSLVMAVVLDSGIKFSSPLRAAFFFPHISSIVAISVVWQFLYAKNGVLNDFLRALGFVNVPAWLSDAHWALPSVMIMIIWKGIGYYMIIYLAGLRSIDHSLYEAATLDGCNGFRSFIHITVPQLRPVTFYISVMCIINSFQVFTPVYIMTKGGPGRATTVLVLQIFTDAFENFKFGIASAEAMVLFLCILVVTLIQFKGQKDI